MLFKFKILWLYLNEQKGRSSNYLLKYSNLIHFELVSIGQEAKKTFGFSSSTMEINSKQWKDKRCVQCQGWKRKVNNNIQLKASRPFPLLTMVCHSSEKYNWQWTIMKPNELLYPLGDRKLLASTIQVVLQLVSNTLRGQALKD